MSPSDSIENLPVAELADLKIDDPSTRKCTEYHKTLGKDALLRLDEEHFSKLFVVGGPGTGKTRLLTQSAVKFAKSMEKNVLCVMPNEKIYKALLREFGKRRMDSEWPQCLNEPGIIVTLEDLDAKLAEEPANVLEGCRLLIGHLGHQFFANILELKNWQYDAVVIDDILFLSHNRYYSTVCARRKRDFVLVAAYDWLQDRHFKVHKSLGEAVHEKTPNRKSKFCWCRGVPTVWMVHMIHSNRPDSLLKWTREFVYSGGLIGRTDRAQGTIELIDNRSLSKPNKPIEKLTAINEGEARIAVEKAEELMKEGTSAHNIIMIADFEHQIELIRRLVDESKICKEVRVGSPFDFRWTPMVRNVIYTMTVSREGGKWNHYLPNLVSWTSVFTRAHAKLIWIGNSEMLAEHKWLSVRNVLKFVKGEEMKERVTD
ncbi:unnamed protein product [Caenorhabditis sp. 36 PRJEB53466]|nr:unnamed protein product [Caenorhabditis sp. 36 PRJEB53466]